MQRQRLRPRVKIYFSCIPSPCLWQSVYRLALVQRDPATRRELLLDAATAILQRAYALELGVGTDSECTALEEAAKHLQKVNLEMQGDRVAMPES